MVEVQNTTVHDHQCIGGKGKSVLALHVFFIDRFDIGIIVIPDCLKALEVALAPVEVLVLQPNGDIHSLCMLEIGIQKALDVATVVSREIIVAPEREWRCKTIVEARRGQLEFNEQKRKFCARRAMALGTLIARLVRVVTAADSRDHNMAEHEAPNATLILFAGSAKGDPGDRVLQNGVDDVRIEFVVEQRPARRWRGWDRSESAADPNDTDL